MKKTKKHNKNFERFQWLAKRKYWEKNESV